MHTHALTTAVTLYRSGTLTLAQAASQAGVSEVDLRATLGKHGIPIREDRTHVEASGIERSTA
jgi:predicted HTH domain antitoxin